MAFRARPATESDAAAIARIYNQAIEERVATFQTQPRTVEEIAATLRERGGRYPAVVVEEADRVIAWAWASPYRARAWYAGIAEFSVYVDRAERGRGAGRMAVEDLIRRCEGLGFWKLLSRIFPENQPSRALCRSLGFREVGTYRRHGKLDGAWRDTVIVERLIGGALE
ncbi:MAG TPA: arsinothricin resistance N-acetyltransferase ArsN1 family A [Candidatus Limnocylindrales bacterium]|nr:arsinothricin resistance N-acetyltransferase ArsN1 family A [Candidatus Limnocylindrales bacterium]